MDLGDVDVSDNGVVADVVGEGTSRDCRDDERFCIWLTWGRNWEVFAAGCVGIGLRGGPTIEGTCPAPEERIDEAAFNDGRRGGRGRTVLD